MLDLSMHVEKKMNGGDIIFGDKTLHLIIKLDKYIWNWMGCMYDRIMSCKHAIINYKEISIC